MKPVHTIEGGARDGEAESGRERERGGGRVEQEDKRYTS
jgi:hypothetical protein